MTSRLADEILAEVERCGVLLVHDQALPSVTRYATGGPVAGSWWSHAMANKIYDALAAIDDRVLTVKLVRKKDTLVARSLWPAIVAIGCERAPWQVDGLGSQVSAILDRVDAAAEPLVVDGAERKTAAELLPRLLVHGTDIHTAAGHHVKAYESWVRWAARQGVVSHGDVKAAKVSIETVVASWPGTIGSKLLPW